MSDKKGRDEYRRAAELTGREKEKVKLLCMVAVGMAEHLMLGIRI